MTESEHGQPTEIDLAILAERARVEALNSEEAKTMTHIAELIYNDNDPAATYQAITKAVVDLVEGIDHASITVATNGRFLSIAASDDIALKIDQLEREVGSGPCLDAINESTRQLDPDIAHDCAWPDLAVRLVAETPVRGLIAFRILVDDRKVGAFNLSSDTPGLLNSEIADSASILAAFASAAFMTFSARGQADTMSRGLASNREIGKAIGLLMAAHHIDADAAFELLRSTSQNLNIKLAEVAQKVVEGQQSQYSSKSKS